MEPRAINTNQKLNPNETIVSTTYTGLPGYDHDYRVFCEKVLIDNDKFDDELAYDSCIGVMDNKNQLQLDEKSLLQDKQDSEPDHGSS
jgi:hypothetical protein